MCIFTVLKPSSGMKLLTLQADKSLTHLVAITSSSSTADWCSTSDKPIRCSSTFKHQECWC